MLVIILIIIASISKSIMDTLQFHYSKSIFTHNQSWWNPKISWEHKYKDNDCTKGPAFPGSTTFLVFLTDAWHFFQFLFLNSLFISIIIATPFPFFGNIWDFILTFLIYRVIFGVIFEISFRIFSKKNLIKP